MEEEERVPDRSDSRSENSGNWVAGTLTLRRGVPDQGRLETVSCLPAEVAGQTLEGSSNARNHYTAMPGMQEPELLDHEEQEDHDGTFGVLEVLQYLQAAYGP